MGEGGLLSFSMTVVWTEVRHLTGVDVLVQPTTAFPHIYCRFLGFFCILGWLWNPKTALTKRQGKKRQSKKKEKKKTIPRSMTKAMNNSSLEKCKVAAAGQSTLRRCLEHKRIRVLALVCLHSRHMCVSVCVGTRTPNDISRRVDHSLH